MLPDLTLSAQAKVNRLSLWVCLVYERLGAIHTPSILDKCEGGIHFITCVTYGDVRDRRYLLYRRLHFPEAYHMDSRIFN